MLYDFRTQTWSEWVTDAGNVGYPSWSADSRSVYYDSSFVDNPEYRRVKLGDHKSEEILSLNGLRRYLGIWGSWSGQAPDDSRLFVRDVSTQEIYELDVDFP